MRLLIVEDSRRLRESLTDGLRSAGYAVDAVADGREALRFARSTDYDLILLDLMIPEVDGLSVLSELRDRGVGSPVLILSARDRVEHRIEGLRTGADDYLVKPFSFDELLARIEALLRRSRGEPASLIQIGGLELDLGAKAFRVGGDELSLTPREYAILEFLVLNRGKVVSRMELEEHIYDAGRQVWSNAVDSAIAAIRRKLAGEGIEGLIQTRRGHGYLVGQADSLAIGGSG